jgi:hypothetical protein
MRVSVWRAASAQLGLVAAITPSQTAHGQTTEKTEAAAPAPVVMPVGLDAGAAGLRTLARLLCAWTQRFSVAFRTSWYNAGLLHGAATSLWPRMGANVPF